MYSHFGGLIFDMDGTLIDSGALHQFAWTSALENYQLPVDPVLMRSLAGVPTKETVEIVVKTFNIQADIDPEEVNTFKEALVHEHFKDYVKTTALESIVLQYHGIKPLAVGTGAYTEEAKNILEACNILHLFDAVIGADQVANPKPAADTFLKAAESIAVKPEECVVFEDSVYGLQAARAAGMHAVDVLETHNIINDYFLPTTQS